MNDTRIEILVNRYLDETREDMVNIADVGLGVSQILPLLVALIVAHKGQIVYIEQPEIHLHPKAHVALARIISESIKEGVTVILETHSELLLRQFQTLIVSKKINFSDVKLHWFERDKNGLSTITSSDVDNMGSFGEWPQDFADISLKSQDDYLTAIENMMLE